MSAWASALELLVGLACVGLGVLAWRDHGVVRAVAVVSGVAGVAAIAHAAMELAQ